METTCNSTSSLGNPPYQLNHGGFGTSAAPIYQMFVEQALPLEPRFAVFVTRSASVSARMVTCRMMVKSGHPK
ncbi:MAG: Eco57I restriction-modification methylase domain-containing protein [Novosphingobium sp.]